MEIHLDRNNPIPIGVQVKEQIKMLVDSAVYKAGDKLPSINSLAESLGINKNTIVAVLKDLENEGYVESYRGKGVFVKEKNASSKIDGDFIDRIDRAIREASSRDIGVNELINFISARYNYALSYKKARVLFVSAISRELVDVNVQKLKQSMPGVEFDGLFASKEILRNGVQNTWDWADLIIVPLAMYGHMKDFLPKDKPMVKTAANLKLLLDLKKGIDKKSRTAVIGLTQTGAQLLAGLIFSSRLFRPRIVLAMNEIEKYKKELKEMDSFVVCISAREAVERLKLKPKDVYFFSDYISDESMEEIRQHLKKV